MKTCRQRLQHLGVFLGLLLSGCSGDRDGWKELSFDVPTSSIAGLRTVHVAGWTRGTEPPNAVIVFLHGVGGTEETWGQLNGNRRLAAVLDNVPHLGVRPIVVAARGDSLGWPNHRDGSVRWRAFLAEELPQFLRVRFGDALTTDRMAYVGTSAGGAAALTMALAQPGRFRCIAAHSPAIHPVVPPRLPAWASLHGWEKEYGSPIDTGLWRGANPIALASTQDSAGLAGLRLYFDVGSEDELGIAPAVSALSDTLRGRGIAHEFYLRKGVHGSAFTGPNLVHSLAFLTHCLADEIPTTASKPFSGK